MKEIGIIVNPLANRGQAVVYARTVIKIFNEVLSDKGYDILDLTGQTYEHSQSLGKKAIDRGLVALIVIGGDGMVSMGVNLLVGKNVPLGIVPAGSGNDFVRSLQVPINQPEIVARGLAAGILKKSYYSIDIGEVKSLDKTKSIKNRYFVSILCGGVDAAISNMANISPIPSAAMRYLSASFWQLVNLPHYGYKLTINNQAIDKPLELLAICNTSYYGNGIKICKEADPTDGFFNIMYSSGISAFKAVYIFIKAMLGISVSHKTVTRIKANKLVIESGGTGQTPPIIQADGEAVGQTPLEIKLIPKALDIIVPPKVLTKLNSQCSY
ncbi:MAG: hypothetical protein LBT99_03065 [Bifidobacteriaceae bacterium]|jgi:diacylglycerol kinase (ATP)|nr:hypothetical protein [Bifidobacteriaceae bacterium]